MSSTIETSAEAGREFLRARGRAVLRRMLAALGGRSNDLMVWDEVRHKVRAGMPSHRGVEAVPLNQIVGSVDRWRDFDRAFLPTQSHTASRWRRIGQAYLDDVYLPPVTLYKVGEVYFVMDGNHRVSVAHQLGREFIDAEVMESRVRVPITPDMNPDDINVVGERTEFLEATGLDETRPEVAIELTIPGGYHRLLEHVAVHRYLQSQEWEREFSDREAASQWLDQVYLPVVEVIRGSRVLDDFPGRTEADLYLWVSEHHHYLAEHVGGGVTTDDAARNFARHFTERPFRRLWHYLRHHVLGGERHDVPPAA